MNANPQNSTPPAGAATKSETDVWTIGRLLSWTAEFLAKSGAENPRLDAEVLLAHSRGCQRIELYTAFTEAAGDELRDKFRKLVKQRADGVPVAYLVGHREFYSLSFRVTRDVLIPRPETEFVVVEALDRITKAPPPSAGDRPLEIVDVGTGSGAIAVSLAIHAPHCRLTAIDISPAALAVARENASQHRVADRIEFVEGDLLSGLDPSRQFDFVVSNPPYVAETELSGLSRDVRDHEPRVALVGGPTGTEVIARLAEQAVQRLVSGGWLILEVSPMIESRVRELLAGLGTFESALVRKDLAGLPRIVFARRNAIPCSVTLPSRDCM